MLNAVEDRAKERGLSSCSTPAPEFARLARRYASAGMPSERWAATGTCAGGRDAP